MRKGLILSGKLIGSLDHGRIGLDVPLIFGTKELGEYFKHNFS